MTEAIWGQILLAVITGMFTVIASIIGLITIRSRARLQRELERSKAETEKAKAEAQIAITKANEQAHLRVIKAEQDIRSMSDQHALMLQLLQLLSDAGRRADEKDGRMQAAMTQLLAASSEGTDTLRIHNQHMVKMLGDIGVVKTDLGEARGLLTLVEQVVSALPTQFDTRTNPMVEALKQLTQRIDALIDSLPASQQQLARNFVEAIRQIKSEAVQEMVSALQPTPLTQSTEVQP